MRSKAKIILPPAVLLLAVVLAVAIVKARPKVERQAAEARPPLIRVVEAEPRDLIHIVHSQGTVVPRIESTLVAQVAGRIDWVSPRFAEGGFFPRDTSLLRIEDREYRLAVAQAQAQVAQARVRLELELAEAEVAWEEWQELGEGDASPLTLRQPQLAEARAAVQAAEAALGRAELDLERTDIRAQFEGRIRKSFVDLGQFVSRGTPLANVYSTDAAELRLTVAKEELAFLEIDPAGLNLAGANPAEPEVLVRGEIGGESHSWQARIVRTGSEFDPKTRMLPLFAQIDDPFRRRPGAHGAPLPMGLFVDAEIAGRQARGVIVLPRAALRGTNQVLVVDAESRLSYRDVDVLRVRGDEVVLRSGLSAGELVCVSPLETVVDGMKVRAVREGELLDTDADKEEQL